MNIAVKPTRRRESAEQRLQQRHQGSGISAPRLGAALGSRLNKLATTSSPHYVLTMSPVKPIVMVVGIHLLVPAY